MNPTPPGGFGIEPFLNVRSATAPSFAPDGRSLAFLTNVTGVPQVWHVPATGGWPTQLTFTADAVRGAWFCPVRHELIYAMDAGGNERTQLYRLRPLDGGTNHGFGDGWTVSPLAADPKAIHNFGGWSRAGHAIAFSANRTKGDRFDLYVQPLDGPAKLIKEGPGGYFAAAGWSPDDKYLLVSRVESNFNQDLYVLEVTTGELKHLTPHQGEAQYHSPAWAGDGKAVYCASTHGGRDRAGLARIDVATGQFTFLETPEHEVEAVTTSAKGRWLAWEENVDGRSVLKLRDLRSGTTRTPALPLGTVAGLTFSPDETQAALVLDGPRLNPDVHRWDLAAEALTQVTHSSRAGLPFGRFVEPQLIRYPTFDGRQIPAWFYPPQGVEPAAAPVIVYPHGGPESQTRPAFNALFQYFLQAGYGILAPNVRGSTGYGTAYMNLDNTTKRMDSVKDLAHAVHWLRDQQKADPKKVAVFGGSYGGFMVLAGVTQYPDLFAAGIDVVGIANFVTFLENTGAYRRAHREAEYGNLREHRAFLEEISPIRHVDKIRCPMLVIHGANDPRVPIGEAEQIVAALKGRGVPVEYLRYEDEGHGLVKLKNRLDAYPKMVAFLDRYVKAPAR